MPDITITFEDGKQHKYENAPDTLKPEDVYSRAQKDFPDAKVKGIARGEAPQPQKEPMYDSRTGAFTRGLLRSTLGAPGDIEKLFGVDIPEYFGQEKQVSPTGGETLFPTSEELKKTWLLGEPKDGKYEDYSTAGELAPVVTAGAGLVKKGIEKILPTAKSYVSTLLGRPATAAGEQLIQKATSAAEGRVGALTSEEKSKLAELQREAERKTVSEKGLSKAEKAEVESAKGLSGARVGEEFGQFGVVTETKDQIGNYLRNQAEKFIDSIKKVRSEKAGQEIAAAKNSALLKEATGNRFIETEKMQKLANYIDSKLAVETDANLVKQLQDVRKSLFAGTENAVPSFESSETIRRKLGDAAFGVPEEGYQAIGQKLAKDIYGKLNDAMKSFEPKFESYLERYKKLSENIEASGSRLGKALVGVEKDAPSYYGATAQSIADKAFSSPENLRTLIDALGGNKQPVLAAAERYFANELATKKTAEEARKFLTSDKTRSLLNELGPEFRKTIQDKFLAGAETQSARANAFKEQIKKSDEVIKGIEKNLEEIRKRSESLNQGLEEIKNAISDQAKRDASSRLITKMQSEVSPQEYAVLKNQIEQYTAAAAEQAKAKSNLIKGVVGGLGLTGAASMFGKSAVSRYLGE